MTVTGEGRNTALARGSAESLRRPFPVSIEERKQSCVAARERGMVPQSAYGLSKLAITKAQLETINVPAKVIVGDRDPVKPLYVAPLRRVRRDWPVVEIEGAGHMNCIVKPRFREEIVSWLEAKQKMGSDAG